LVREAAASMDAFDQDVSRNRSCPSSWPLHHLYSLPRSES
jgi:hypothetical protein